jgi:hypothetical protein
MNKYLKPLSQEDLKKKYKGRRDGKLETVTAEDILVMFSKRRFIIEAN